MPSCGRVPAPEDGAGVSRITRRNSRGMTRKILFGALTLALLVAGFSVASFPALAELRIITITLEGGQEVVTTVDVPPGTPPEAIQLPEISAPVKKVRGRRPAAAEGSRPTKPDEKPPKDKAKEESPGKFLEEDEPAKPKREKREKTKPGDIRTPDGAPTARQPDADARPPRTGAGRRSQLRHQQVPHPAVPAADLPGRRHAVRDPLGGPRGDQRDRDRLRPQPERVVRRRARLDAVHPVVVALIWSGREPRRREGPLQPRRRDLRRRPLPEGGRRRERPASRDLRLQPRRLVRRLGDAARAPDLRPAGRPRRVADRSHAGSLPGPRPRPLRGRPRRARPAPARPQDPRARTTPPRSSTRTTAAARSTSTRAAALR